MGGEKTSIKNKILSAFDKLKSGKGIQYFSIILIAIILILCLTLGFSDNDKTEKTAQKDSVESYVSDLEKRLSIALSKVNGVGDVSIVITVESGMETVLASKKTTIETSDGVEIEETPIIINGKTVVIKETYPKIIGVLIVAKGADNFSAMARIQQAVISLLDINLNQIEILTMK